MGQQSNSRFRACLIRNVRRYDEKRVSDVVITRHARPISDQSYPSVADEQEISVGAERDRRRPPQQVDSLPLGIGPYLDPLDLIQDQAELRPVEHGVAVPIDTPYQTGVGLRGAQPEQRFVRIVTEAVYLGMVDVLYDDV
ncbi:hypothetical protein [Nocardia gipuzkoensis]|uniref:hypothetical protein n=1 Tax=Nocardia gipuzkoensis TaxID=2749991 RepID=UPI0015EEE451|nr:hypothetical protein [Nocardia gipuzkoensis]